MDEQFPKPALDKFRQWHFWWLVIFSFLLIITFVYYLPTRFLQQMGMPHEKDEHMQEHMEQGMSEEEMKKHMKEGHDDQMMPALPAGGDEHIEDGMMDDEMVEDHDDDNVEHVPPLYQEEGNVKEGVSVNLNISPVPYNVGISLSVDFFVNTKPGNIPVLANQLQIEHTKLMHVVGVRSDMNEFFHIHPVQSSLAEVPSGLAKSDLASETLNGVHPSKEEATFTIQHVFKKPGLYKIWSSVKKDGVDHTFGHPEVNINGVGPREDKQVSFSRNIMTGNYQVSFVTDDAVVKGREVEISFDIHTLTGQEITVEDYLDAQMHLVIIKDDWKQFIHTHPASHDAHSYNDFIPTAKANGDDHSDQAGDEVISFAVTLPEAGLYKAFAQFRPQGINLPADEAITAEFWIEVLEKSPSIVSQWWGLLIFSVLLIAGLGWWVNNYLKVKSEDVLIKK